MSSPSVMQPIQDSLFSEGKKLKNRNRFMVIHELDFLLFLNFLCSNIFAPVILYSSPFFNPWLWQAFEEFKIGDSF